MVGDAQIRGLSGALAANDADLWVLASGAQGALSASRVEPTLLGTVSAVEGIARVAPIGEVRVGVRIEGGALVDASLWGIDPASPAAPPVIDGLPATDPGQAVVDGADRHLGAVPGARLVLVVLPVSLQVVGVTEGRRFASIPTITIPYVRWAEIVNALNPDSDEVVPTAFAVELEPAADPSEVAAAAGRWHYVGMPVTLGLGRTADIEAMRFGGDGPDWSGIEPTTVTLFYPGVIGWDYLTDRRSHSGADAVDANRSFDEAHTEDKMAFYALESEFRDDIIAQWLLTTVLWTLFILAVTGAFVPLAMRYGRQRIGSDTIVREDALRAEEHRA